MKREDVEGPEETVSREASRNERKEKFDLKLSLSFINKVNTDYM